MNFAIGREIGLGVIYAFSTSESEVEEMEYM
jgi:hypothetical protein